MLFSKREYRRATLTSRDAPYQIVVLGVRQLRLNIRTYEEHVSEICVSVLVCTSINSCRIIMDVNVRIFWLLYLYSNCNYISVDNGILVCSNAWHVFAETDPPQGFAAPRERLHHPYPTSSDTPPHP